ncbi:1,4-beta-xylanase [Salegentibacter salinarum]|uniref:Beta-xylanase n=1 Tax=Salegentibacter salinarum TaxID=447422 RepID=A0A2N0TMC1_9FLAO|nr:endo-1,4-beta-xylanase [Salegentibacter salinarum]PKD15876.1 1,4-beta-xylanase [Salegentibacter salinarum]SKB72293.1 endo-1,4-beta-xylanase [Salegentibacter salinarum]
MLKRKNFSIFILLLSVFFTVYSCNSNKSAVDKSELSKTSLKDAFEGKFHIGTTLNAWQIMGRQPEEIKVATENFNSIVAENIMKSARIQPNEGEFNFELADEFVKIGEENNMHIHGHTLIWHSQAPDWFFKDEDGNTVSKEVLTQRMKDHIHAVVGRYKGRIHSWDVVNEAIEDDGSYRKSKFFEILGEDFIKLAFEFAHEADPDAELYYNDYSMAIPGKRAGVVRMVEKLQYEGITVNGIGMQGHIGLNNPSISEFEKSIEDFGKLGKVMITELDLSVLPSPWGDAGAELSDTYEYEDKMNPFPDGLPANVEQQFTRRYVEYFELFLKHQDKISRVALWGVNDGNSWKNNWPVRGRTDYPLLFDRENNAKPVVKELIELAAAN